MGPPALNLIGATLNAILTVLYVLAGELTYTPVFVVLTMGLLWMWAYTQRPAERSA